jgi:hypothetical protein
VTAPSEIASGIEDEHAPLQAGHHRPALGERDETFRLMMSSGTRRRRARTMSLSRFSDVVRRSALLRVAARFCRELATLCLPSL